MSENKYIPIGCGWSHNLMRFCTSAMGIYLQVRLRLTLRFGEGRWGECMTGFLSLKGLHNNNPGWAVAEPGVKVPLFYTLKGYSDNVHLEMSGQRCWGEYRPQILNTEAIYTNGFGVQISSIFTSEYKVQTHSCCPIIKCANALKR